MGWVNSQCLLLGQFFVLVDSLTAIPGISKTSIGLSRPGSAKLTGSQSVDKEGNLHLKLQITGVNGFSGWPGAPKGDIKINLNLIVTPDGKVGIDKGSESTNYPAILGQPVRS